MEDLSAMITGLLNSPDGMEKLKTMADGLLAQNGNAPSPATPENNTPSLPNLSVGELSGLMKMANLLKNTGDDSRAQLLLAIRPHLTPARQKRVDDAVKILKLITVLPVIKEAGIF